MQAFRPIDFILLSLFEVSRSHLLAKRDLTINELNNWLCILIIHVYLLLTHSNEEQILIRLYHLVPEISHSYENLDGDAKFAHAFRSGSACSNNSRFPTDSDTESELDTDSSNDDKERLVNKAATKEKNKMYFDSDGLEYNDDTNSEYDLNGSALYLARFLLKSFEKVKKNNSHMGRDVPCSSRVSSVVIEMKMLVLGITLVVLGYNSGITNNEPDITRNNPGSTRNNPGSTRNNPGSTRNNPGSTRNNPGSTRNNPGSTREDPGITRDDLRITRDVSDITRDSPNINRDDPGTTGVVVLGIIWVLTKNDQCLTRDFSDITRNDPGITRKDQGITMDYRRSFR